MRPRNVIYLPRERKFETRTKTYKIVILVCSMHTYALTVYAYVISKIHITLFFFSLFTFTNITTRKYRNSTGVAIVYSCLERKII